MSDNFGSGQNRVLTVSDRSLDNVVFQYKRPPLTSEWNLINQICNEKNQTSNKFSCPSGWLNVGEILQNATEADILTGQVNCSPSYTANTFKLFSKSGCKAIVNGWPLLIQGTNSSDDNNVIQLNAPEGQYYDFVFLEVWRKLVSSSDSLYPYGNVLTTPYTDNEIEWSVIGAETTKRVQIQYRIRSVKINGLLSGISDIFSDEIIYPIGGRTTGEYAFPSYAFRKYGAADAGLYISGDGSSTSESILNTVDGYVYAIPMFLVYRRVESDDIFIATQMRRTFVNKEDSNNGYRSDRPDGAILDVVYASDIVDYRHKILTSGKEIDITLQQTLSKLISGELSTALKRGFGDAGEDTTASSGGSTVMKVERINGGVDGIPNMGTGSEILFTAFKRRAFCNAEITLDHNVIEIPINGATWAEGTIPLATVLSTAPAGELVSVDGFYLPNAVDPIPTGVTCDDDLVNININEIGGNSIVGTTEKLLMEYTYTYYSSDSGFKDVPKEILEAGKGTYLPIATRDNTVPLRFNNTGYLLNFGLNPGVHTPGEIDSRDFLRYRGGNYTESSRFGHEMVVYRTTNGAGSVTLTLTNNKLAGYYIMGVKSVEQVSAPDVPVNFTQSRQVTVSPYTISSYTVTAGAIPNTAVRIILYVGSGFLQNSGDTYSLSDSLKFFETNKQGRGVIDTYEVIEVIASHDGGSIYTVDSGDKPIIALVSMVDSAGIAQPYAFKYQTAGVNAAINLTYGGALPVLSSSEYSPNSLPTKIKVTAASTDSYLRIPVLVHSYVAQSETPYNFYYKTHPYQGILSGDIYGKIIDQGPAIITSLGSGAITNYSYSVGRVQINISGSTVTGIAYGGNTPEWLSHVQAGDYIRITATGLYYRIVSVNSNTEMTIAHPYKGVTETNAVYDIMRMDVPKTNISNVVDRMPSLKISSVLATEITDYKCYSDDEILLKITQPELIYQDPMLAMVNDFKLGNTAAKRGRNDFRLTMGDNEIFKLSSYPRPYIVYEDTEALYTGRNKKVYQVYIFNRSAKDTGGSDLTGRIYMLVISGEMVSTTKNMLNGMKDFDTVDLFELVGRPLIKFD